MRRQKGVVTEQPRGGISGKRKWSACQMLLRLSEKHVQWIDQ